jgi:ribonuclease P/MRP protein subunit RPP40
MVSGLKSADYEERLKELGLSTLEERRHQVDMHMVHKILHRYGGLDARTWFESTGVAALSTRSGADPLNMRVKAARLDIRRQFFSQRVISDRNKIPAEIKGRKSAAGFKAAYRRLRERPAHHA